MGSGQLRALVRSLKTLLRRSISEILRFLRDLHHDVDKFPRLSPGELHLLHRGDASLDIGESSVALGGLLFASVDGDQEDHSGYPGGSHEVDIQRATG